MNRLFVNWKTSGSGLVSAFFTFVAFAPAWFPHWLVDVSHFAVAGGLAAFGFAAKDLNVTGGSKPNS